MVQSDGADLWVADSRGDVERIRASDGKLLGTWSGAVHAFGVLVARGRVYVTGLGNPGALYAIDPSMPAGPVTLAAGGLDNNPFSVTSDGSFIWTANGAVPGSVSKVDPDSGATTNVSTGFTKPVGILFDGSDLWVTDEGDNSLKKVDSSGNVIQSVAVGVEPGHPVFDGSNIWVPNFGNSITVVRARDGLVLATLTGNGLSGPTQAAFDGQRILVTNRNGESLSLWKATDLSPIGTFSAALTLPSRACSDGINFWIVLADPSQLARF
jgi:hypothetical protein